MSLYSNVLGCVLETRENTNDDYMKIMDDVLNSELNYHSRLLVIRFDLHLPKCDDENDIIKINRVNLTNRFIRAIESRLKYRKKRKERNGKRCHSSSIGYTWVKEYSKSDNEHHHYHFFMTFNKDTFCRLGLFEYGLNNLCNLINNAWGSALGIDNHDSWSFIHFPKNPSYFLNRNDECFDDEYKRLIHRLSYMAKYRDKMISKRSRSIGASIK